MSLKILKLLCINFLVFLVFFEIELNLLSLFYSLRGTESVKSVTSNELRIMVIGESTSADQQNEFDSWPKKLEQKLIKEGVNAGGNFGHTTELGNEIISDQIKNEILLYIKN